MNAFHLNIGEGLLLTLFNAAVKFSIEIATFIRSMGSVSVTFTFISHVQYIRPRYMFPSGFYSREY